MTRGFRRVFVEKRPATLNNCYVERSGRPDGALTPPVWEAKHLVLDSSPFRFRITHRYSSCFLEKGRTDDLTPCVPLSIKWREGSRGRGRSIGRAVARLPDSKS